MVLPAQPQAAGVVLQQELQGAPGVVPAPFRHAGIALDVPEMAPEVGRAHHQAAEADLRQGLGVKVLLPAEGDVAPLHNEVLPVFQGGFDHLPDNGPQIALQLPVVLRRQGGVPASDQPHF